MTTARALRMLDLEQPVAPPELRQAYRDLVRVWHPDRFEGDARLRLKASVRLAEINAAYRFLGSLVAEPPRVRAAAPVRRASPPNAATHAAAAHARARRAARATAQPHRRGNAGRAARHIGLLGVVLAIFALGAAPRLETVLESRPVGGTASAASDIVLPAARRAAAPPVVAAPVVAAPVVAAAVATGPVVTHSVGGHGAVAGTVTPYPRRSPFSLDLDRILARARR